MLRRSMADTPLREQLEAAQDRAERLGRRLTRILDAAPRLRSAGSLADAAHEACAATAGALGADLVVLWRVEATELRRLGVHAGPALAADAVAVAAPALMPIDEVPSELRPGPGDVAVVDPARLDGPSGRIRDALGATALVVVPVGIAAGTVAFLTAAWQEAPSPEDLDDLALAAQRLAEVVGLALEHALRREVQAELVQLTDAIGHLSQATLDLPRDAAPEAVGRTVCAAARDAFAADACSIWRLGDDTPRTLRLLARVPDVSAGAPTVLPLGRDLDDQVAALEAGEVVAVEDAGRAMPELFALLPEHLRMRAQVRVPLELPGGQAGMLLLSWRAARPVPSTDVLVLARRLGDQAAVALADASRRSAEAETRTLLRSLEESLLPSSRHDLPVDVHLRLRPGEERMRLGGDFLDALELPDGTVATVIGDVAGHGPQSAATGAELRAAWRALTLVGLPEDQVLAGLDALLVRRGDPGLFATVCACRFDPARSRAHAVLAGHPPPLVLARDATEPVPMDLPVGPPLGIAAGHGWEPAWARLPGRGWKALLFTDGLVEGRASPGSPQRFGVARLAERFGVLADQDADGLLDGLLDAAEAAHGGALPDDAALLLACSRED